MKCEFCHLNEACVEVQQITEEGLRQVRMCMECAAAKGLKPPDDLTGLLAGDGLFPADADKAGLTTAESKVSCPVCHMQAADFRKTSRLGCDHCYETFSGLLKPMLESMHRATDYAGKHPVDETIRQEIAGLKTALKRAVRAEAYEEAADLRDRIQQLERNVTLNACTQKELSA